MDELRGPDYWDNEDSKTDRGMSEAVVVLLLIGIAVIVVALIAIFVFDLVPGGDSVQANLQFTQTSGDSANVTIYHGGGDPLPDGTHLTAGGAIDFADDDSDIIASLSGLSPGEEVTFELTDGSEGDRMSVVHEGTVLGNFDLLYDV